MLYRSRPLWTATTVFILVVAAPRFASARQSLVPPTIQSISPNKVSPGTTVTAVINGLDLAGATSVQVSEPGITASIVSNNSPSTLTVSLSISESAPTGIRSITVTAPAGISTPCNACLTVFIAGGRWADAGTMSAPRIYHMATLLNDGRVLIAGGNANGLLTDSAELYDPITRSWSRTGSLGAARVAHTATLLPNGKVLVTGGANDASGLASGSKLASAEIYDPANGQWSPTGFMNTQRAGQTATLLPNGLVLVAGGSTADGQDASAELYNPATGQFTTTTPMNRAHTPSVYGGFSAILLPNDRVLVTDPLFFSRITAELYDPTTSRWTETNSMIQGSDNYSVLLPAINKVLNPGIPSQLYDPITGWWSWTGSMIIGRKATVPTVLRNGKVLMVGACCLSAPFAVDTSAELYDPAPGVWNLTASSSVPHRGHTATLLNDGTVLVAGGGSNLAEIYVPDGALENPPPPPPSVIPAPKVTDVQLTEFREGSAPITLKILGSNFLSTAQVFLGQTFLRTTSITQSTITAAFPGSLWACAVTQSLMVRNPPPGGGDSAPFLFKVPLGSPTITTVSPGTGVPGTSFIMTVTGTNLCGATEARFYPGDVRANIAPDRTATSLSLLVTVPPEAGPGQRSLSITTPYTDFVGSGPFFGFTVLASSISPSPPPTGPSRPQRIPEVEDGNVQTGYLVITPDQNTSAPFTTLQYGTVQNGIVQDQGNVVPLGVTTGATLFIDFLNSASRNLGLVIVNPGGATNAITLTLKNNDGTTASTATVNIDPYKQVAKFVNELFPDAVGPAFMGSINVQSGSPFAVLGFPFAGANFSTLGAGNTGTLTAVPTRTSSGSIGGANAIILPQFVMGGGWATQVALVNTTGTAATGRIDVFDTNGQPTALKLNGDTKSTFTYSIPAGGTFILGPRDQNGQTPL